MKLVSPVDMRSSKRNDQNFFAFQCGQLFAGSQTKRLRRPQDQSYHYVLVKNRVFFFSRCVHDVARVWKEIEFSAPRGRDCSVESNKNVHADS